MAQNMVYFDQCFIWAWEECVICCCWKWGISVYYIQLTDDIVELSYVLTDSSVGKESACNEGDTSLTPGSGRSAGEGKGYLLQYSGLENSMDCIVHGVTKSQIWLNDFHFHWFSTCWIYIWKKRGVDISSNNNESIPLVVLFIFYSHILILLGTYMLSCLISSWGINHFIIM